MQTAELTADLERGLGLAAAKELAARQSSPPPAPESEGSMMPGGADSAPVSATEKTELSHAPSTSAPVAAEPSDTHAPEPELNILHEAAEGTPPNDIATLVHEAEGAGGLRALVKGIVDVAQGVRI